MIKASYGLRRYLILVILLCTLLGITIARFPLLGGVVLALIILIAATIILIQKPAWICYILVFLTPLVSGMPRGELFPFFRPNEIILIGLFIILIILRILSSGSRILFRITVVDKTFAVLLLLGTLVPLLAYVVRNGSVAADGIFVYLSIIQYYLLYRIIIETIKTEEEIANVIKLFLISGILVTFAAILEAVNFPGIDQILLTFYPSRHLDRTLSLHTRIASVLGNWHGLAAFAVLQILVAMVFWTFIDQKMISRWLLGISASSGVLSLIPTASFAGLAGLGTLLLSFIILIRKSWKIFIPLLIIGIVALGIFWPYIQARLLFQFGTPNSLIPQTLSFRFRVWSDVFLPVIRKYLVFGYSPVIPAGFGWVSHESQYIALLFRGGVLLLFAHLYFVVVNMKWLYAHIRFSTGMTRAVSICALISLLILSIMGFTNEYFSYSGAAETVWILLGLAMVTT